MDSIKMEVGSIHIALNMYAYRTGGVEYYTMGNNIGFQGEIKSSPGYNISKHNNECHSLEEDGSTSDDGADEVGRGTKGKAEGRAVVTASGLAACGCTVSSETSVLVKETSRTKKTYDRVPEELGEPLVGRELMPGAADEPGAPEETGGTAALELTGGTDAALLSGTSGTAAEEDSMMGGDSPGRLEVGSTSAGVELSS